MVEIEKLIGSKQLFQIPEEIWAEIFRYLDLPSQIRLVGTCRFFQQLKRYVVIYNPVDYSDLTLFKYQHVNVLFSSHQLNEVKRFPQLKVVRAVSNPQQGIDFTLIPLNINTKLFLDSQSIQQVPIALYGQITNLHLHTREMNFDLRGMVSLTKFGLSGKCHIQRLILPLSVTSCTFHGLAEIPINNISELKLRELSLNKCSFDISRYVWDGLKHFFNRSLFPEGINVQRFTELISLDTYCYLQGTLPKTLQKIYLHTHKNDHFSDLWFRDRNGTLKERCQRLRILIGETDVTELALPEAYMGIVPRLAQLRKLTIGPWVEHGLFHQRFNLISTQLEELTIRREKCSYPGLVRLKCPPTLKRLILDCVIADKIKLLGPLDYLESDYSIPDISKMTVRELKLTVSNGHSLPKGLQILHVRFTWYGSLIGMRQGYLDIRKAKDLRMVYVDEKHSLKMTSEQLNGLKFRGYLPHRLQPI